jgi:hypothetical protein
MDRKQIPRTLLLTFLPLCSSTLLAATIEVGTTIQAAVNLANPGDVIEVPPGEYTENITLGDSDVTIIGAGPENTIIVGGIRTLNRNGITISNLTVRKGHNWGDDGNDDPGIRLEQNTSGHVLSDLILDGTDHTASARGVLFHANVTNVTITNVAASGWEHGVFINPGSSVTFTNYQASAGGTIGADGAKSIVVEDSTFTDASISLSDYTAPGGATGLTVSGTTFTGTLASTSASISLWDSQTAGWAGGPVSISNSTFSSNIPLKLTVGASWPPSATQALTGLTFNNSNNVVTVAQDSSVTGSITPVNAGILLAGSDGTVNIGPGSYTELATQNLALRLDNPVTLQGVDADGVPITSVDDVVATIASGGESNWGTNFYVTAPNVTISGLRFEAKKTNNSDSQCSANNVNKAIEVLADNFVIEHSIVAAVSGFNYDCATSTALYFGDEGADDLNNFTVRGNQLHGGITITNGAGDGGGAVNFTITDNVFTGHHFLRVRGAVNGVGWLNHSAHVPTTVANNDMSGVSTYLVQVWGDDAADQATSDFVSEVIGNNELGSHVYVMSDDGPRLANYSEYNGNAPAFFIRRSLPDALATAQDNDTIHVDGQFALSSRISLAKPGLTLTGTGAATTLTSTGSAIAVTASGVTISNLSVLKSGALENYGVEVTGSIEDLALSGVTIEGFAVGFRIGSGAGLNGLAVSNSHFDNNNFGWYIAYDTNAALADASRVRDITVTGSTFNRNLSKGIYAEKLETASFDHIEVVESGTLQEPWPPGNGVDINLKRAAYASISFTNSLFQDSGEFEPDLIQVATPRNNLDAALAIKARDDGSYSAIPATLTGVTIANNTFISSDSTLARVAIRIGEGDQTNAGPSNVTITGNKFTGFEVLLHNATTTQVTAEQNWWGSPAGPATSIIGDVDYAPWYVNANLTALSTATSSLTIQTQPGGAQAGSTLSPAPVVLVKNAEGAPVVGATVTVQLSTGSFGSGATSATTGASGLATFSGLTIGAAGSYTLTFTSGSFTAVSNAITITAVPTTTTPDPEPEPEPNPGTGTGTGGGTGGGTGTGNGNNEQPVPQEDLTAIDNAINDVVIPDEGEDISDASVDAVSNAAAVSSALVTEIVSNIDHVDTHSAVDALSVLSKVTNVSGNAAQSAASGGNAATTQTVTQAGTRALSNFASLLSAIDRKVNRGSSANGGTGSTPPAPLSVVEKEVVQQNTIQTVAAAVKLVSTAASAEDKQALLQDVGKIITANLNLGVPMTSAQTAALVAMAQGATDPNASVESQVETGVEIKPENKELISKADLTAALAGSGVTEAEVDQFLAELANAINPADVVLGDTNGEEALANGLQSFNPAAQFSVDPHTGSLMLIVGGNAGQTLTVDGRSLSAVTAPQTIPARVVSTRIVASTVPDGMRVRSNGSITITSSNIASTIVPAAYDPISLYADLKPYGTVSIDDVGRVSVIGKNFRFSGTFDFNGVAIGAGSPGDVTRVQGPTTGASEADVGYQFSLTYPDGTTQVLQPYIHDNGLVASLRSRGLEPKVNRNNGVIDVSGTYFRPSYFVTTRTSSDVLYWYEHKDASGLAYRLADLNGDGTIDVEVISSTGIQVAYRLP